MLLINSVRATLIVLAMLLVMEVHGYWQSIAASIAFLAVALTLADVSEQKLIELFNPPDSEA